MSVVRLSLEGYGPQGEDIVNVLHYETPTPFADVAALQASLEAILADTLYAPYLAALTNDYQYFRSVATVIAGTDTGFQAISVVNTDDIGGIAGLSAPLQTAVVLKKSTGVAQRSAQGRLFISPRLRTDFDVDGRCTASPLTAIAALCTALETADVAAGVLWTPVVWSETYQGSTPITAVTQSPAAGVRRSRRYNVGA